MSTPAIFRRFDEYLARRQQSQHLPSQTIQQGDADSPTPLTVSTEELGSTAVMQAEPAQSEAERQTSSPVTTKQAKPSRHPIAFLRSSRRDIHDLQILALHQQMVEKLIASPQLAAPLLERLEARYQAKQLRHGAFLFWHCALTQLDHPELVRASLLSMEPSACRYRRRTQLSGLLSEHERQHILEQLRLGPKPEIVVKNP